LWLLGQDGGIRLIDVRTVPSLVSVGSRHTQAG
jgi:hypothetical protein